jgi:Na+-transporting methylmalonyl-CoA/oxaloacetate decarboxylase beta subunit
LSDPIDLMNIMQIDWLQPIYTLTFSNGLIACLVFMGIGVLLDVGYVMARPFQSMFIALFAELGTIAVFPIAVWLGLNPGQAAAR